MSLLRQAFEKTNGQALCIACDITNLPFQPASFDTILMIRVFHHIPDSQAFLAELHRILCHQGRFIFSYRNKRNALHAAQWLLGRSVENPFTLEPAGVGTTLISHHPKVVHQMLLQVGFANLEYYGTGVFDWLAGKLGAVGKWIPSGRKLAGALGQSKIAPWIICGAKAHANAGLIDPQSLADLLMCPCCGGNLSGDMQMYFCLGCGKGYPVDNGIIDLRL